MDHIIPSWEKGWCRQVEAWNLLYLAEAICRAVASVMLQACWQTSHLQRDRLHGLFPKMASSRSPSRVAYGWDAEMEGRMGLVRSLWSSLSLSDIKMVGVTFFFLAFGQSPPPPTLGSGSMFCLPLVHASSFCGIDCYPVRSPIFPATPSQLTKVCGMKSWMVTPEIGEPDCLLFTLNWFRLSCKSCMAIQLSKLQLQLQHPIRIAASSMAPMATMTPVTGSWQVSKDMCLSSMLTTHLIWAYRNWHANFQACRSVHTSLFYFNFWWHFVLRFLTLGCFTIPWNIYLPGICCKACIAYRWCIAQG